MLNNTIKHTLGVSFVMIDTSFVGENELFVTCNWFRTSFWYMQELSFQCLV